jgi:hypothetical protein
MSDYTPGPWKVQEPSMESPGMRTIVDASGRYIGGVTRDEARLIAAAPDLLTALEDVKAALVRDGIAAAPGRGPDDPRIRRAGELLLVVKDAITKATGVRV